MTLTICYFPFPALYWLVKEPTTPPAFTTLADFEKSHHQSCLINHILIGFIPVLLFDY
jgi:hypothetical protein